MSGADGGGRDPSADTMSHLWMPADALSLRALTGWLTGLLAATGSEAPGLQSRIELAVHEVCMNVVDHAYARTDDGPPGEIAVEGCVRQDCVLIVVRDNGIRFDPDRVHPPVAGVPQIGGYGLLIAGKLADDLSYQREAGTNAWSLLFNRVRADQEKTP